MTADDPKRGKPSEVAGWEARILTKMASHLERILDTGPRRAVVKGFTLDEVAWRAAVKLLPLSVLRHYEQFRAAAVNLAKTGQDVPHDWRCLQARGVRCVKICATRTTPDDRMEARLEAIWDKLHSPRKRIAKDAARWQRRGRGPLVRDIKDAIRGHTDCPKGLKERVGQGPWDVALFTVEIARDLETETQILKEIEAAMKAEAASKSGAVSEPTDGEKAVSLGKGVSMLDAALILNDDNREPARDTVDRWQKQRRVKAPPCIGYAPSRHSQMKLYEPPALADFVEKIEPSSVIEKRAFRQRLIGRAILVEIGPDRK